MNELLNAGFFVGVLYVILLYARWPDRHANRSADRKTHPAVHG